MKNFKPLSKSEMKKVIGGASCMVDADCLPGQICNPSSHNCYYDDGSGYITCTITGQGGGCGTGGTITMPVTQDPYAWCNSQPCCASIYC
jgi:bacteriocin-like protein